MFSIYKKILLAIDESEEAARATDKVIEIAQNWDCKVLICHSIKHTSRTLLAPVMLSSYAGSYYRLEEKYQKECEEKGKKLLEEKKKLFTNVQLPVETKLITGEKPEDYIERITKEENIDLIVIGVKGIHSKLKEIFWGSVTKKVIKHVPCDVLVIK